MEERSGEIKQFEGRAPSRHHVARALFLFPFSLGGAGSHLISPMGKENLHE